MVRLRDISIKRKLMLIIMAASTLALLLVAGAFVAYEMITWRHAMTRDLSTLAAIIGDRSTAALTFDNKEDAQETLGALAARSHISGAALYKEGKIFATYPPGKISPGTFPAWPEQDGARFQKDRLVVFQAIKLRGEPLGTICLQSDLGEMHERFNRYAAIVLLILLASSAVTYLFSAWLQRIISRPIFELATTARAVSVHKDYSMRVAKRSRDELGQLTDDFNEMLARIQSRDAALSESNDLLEKRVEERTVELRAEVTERQRAEAGLQEQFNRISLLNEITQIISERQDTESILHVVLRQLEDHLNLDLGFVALFDEKADTLNIGALRVKNALLAPELDLHENMVLPLPETGLRDCCEGQTVYLSDTYKYPTALAERLAGAGLRSAVGVPLLVEGKLFGVLFSVRLAANGFRSGDCEFLRMLSEHVALAAHQARLHSELERAYNELRQTQATVMQQERLKALGQMASGIAHDVNNALSPVVGFADLMMRAETLSPNGKRYLKHIRTAGEDIAHIVSRLREFYRQRDEQETLQELNLNTLAEQVVDMTRPRWRDIPQSRGVTIGVQAELAPDVPDLPGIESEIREALTNLVLNAVDALPNGGKITLRTRLNRAPVVDDGGDPPLRVEVEVSDTGTGMSEETRRRCLEPFFSTKGKRGTGLGLAMVYGVMERHDGKVEVDSELGKGSTFRLIFPVRKETQTAVAAPEVGEPIEPLQILCIDDEPLLRDLLKEMLMRDGHTVELSDGGQAGIDAFRSAQHGGKPFDIVITDLGMPYVDGRQVVRTLKEESPTTPIVMLTGWGVFMKEDGSAPAQVDGVLSKPPRSKELREALGRLTKERPDTVPV